jgi:hypothetical protein
MLPSLRGVIDHLVRRFDLSPSGRHRSDRSPHQWRTARRMKAEVIKYA